MAYCRKPLSALAYAGKVIELSVFIRLFSFGRLRDIKNLFYSYSRDI